MNNFCVKIHRVDKNYVSGFKDFKVLFSQGTEV